MGRKRKIMDPNKPWKKKPRSSLPCILCSHLRSSHSAEQACIKLVMLRPKKIECECVQFILNKEELELYRNSIEKKLAKKGLTIDQIQKNYKYDYDYVKP